MARMGRTHAYMGGGGPADNPCLTRLDHPLPLSRSGNGPFFFLFLLAVCGESRRTETDDAPVWRGAAREQTGSMRPRSNAAGRDAAPVERSWTFTTGLLRPEHRFRFATLDPAPAAPHGVGVTLPEEANVVAFHPTRTSCMASGVVQNLVLLLRARRCRVRLCARRFALACRPAVTNRRRRRVHGRAGTARSGTVYGAVRGVSCRVARRRPRTTVVGKHVRRGLEQTALVGARQQDSQHDAGKRARAADAAGGGNPRVLHAPGQRVPSRHGRARY